jgi:hypothetical protein
VRSAGSFGNGRGGWLIAARRGYLDLALRLAGVADSVSPRYGDLFAKVTTAMGQHDRLTGELLWATDGFDYTSSTGAISSGYGSAYGWLTWESWPSSSLSGRTTLSSTRLTWRRVGHAAGDFSTSGEIREDRAYSAPTIATDWSWTPSTPLVIRWGGSIRPERASYDESALRTAPTVVGDSAFFRVERNSESLSPAGTEAVAYLAPRLQPLSWLTVEPGIRYERSTYSSDETLSPRFNVLVALTPSTALRLVEGRYTQSLPIYGLQLLDGVTRFAPADLSIHRIVAVEQRIGSATTARVEAYERRVTREHPRYVDLEATSNAFPELAGDRVLLQATSGRARGIELSAQHRTTEGFGWMASYARARVTDDVDGKSIPRTYDQEHTAYVDASYQPHGSNWRLSGGWQLHSGWPAAPVTFRLDTIAAGAGATTVVQSTYGPIGVVGQERLPWYHRVDVRATRDVLLSRSRLSFFVDVFNLFDSPNARAYQYTIRPISGRLVVARAPERQFGRIPSAGVSWTF